MRTSLGSRKIVIPEAARVPAQRELSLYSGAEQKSTEEDTREWGLWAKYMGLQWWSSLLWLSCIKEEYPYHGDWI